MFIYYSKCHYYAFLKCDYINGNDMYLKKSYNDVTERIFYSFFITVKRKDALKKKFEMSIPNRNWYIHWGSKFWWTQAIISMKLISLTLILIAVWGLKLCLPFLNFYREKVYYLIDSYILAPLSVIALFLKLIFIYLFIFPPHCAACGILLPWPGIKPIPLALECRVFSSRLPRKSLSVTSHCDQQIVSLSHRQVWNGFG